MGYPRETLRLLRKKWNPKMSPYIFMEHKGIHIIDLNRTSIMRIDRNITTVIDPGKCIGCGLCVKVCPSETISMQDDKARVTGDRSLQCGHCVAVCPVDAVRVDAIDAQSLSFNSFDLENDWLPHGESDTAHLVQLMASRRSCRSGPCPTPGHRSAGRPSPAFAQQSPSGVSPLRCGRGRASGRR